MSTVGHKWLIRRTVPVLAIARIQISDVVRADNLALGWDCSVSALLVEAGAVATGPTSTAIEAEASNLKFQLR